MDKVRDNIIEGIWLIISYFSLTVLKLFSFETAVKNKRRLNCVLALVDKFPFHGKRRK